MVRYQPKGLSTGNGSGTGEGAAKLTTVQFDGSQRKNKDRDIMGTVTLPIQSGIQDSNNVDWGENQLSAIQLILLLVRKQRCCREQQEQRHLHRI